ncbi:hypothetical protein JXM83_02530, partial [Candidatus Woesearchaeota archaeon]|nr:hypothetical protein [Candidatus Woesearchaeota archaeon]
YLNDQFPYRTQLISFLNINHIKLFQQAINDKIIVGKEGWFYLNNPELEAHLPDSLYTEYQLSLILSNLEERKNYVEENGGKFYFIIVPSKYSVYPEFLHPRFTNYSGITKRIQLVDYLKKKTVKYCVDLTDTLLNHKNSGLKMFYKTDNHWTPYGAFFGTNAILQRIKFDIPDINLLDLKDYSIEKEISINGNLTSMIGLQSYFPESNLHFTSIPKNYYQRGQLRGYPQTTKFPEFKDFEIVFNGHGKYRLLLIRESFAYMQEIFIAPQFKESVFIFDGWQHGSNKNIIESEKADIVILQIQEPFLDNLLKK